MFEDSTFESQGRIQTRSRRWSLAALAFNGSIVAAIIVFPLIFPESLPRRWNNILLTAPAAPQERARVEAQPRAASSAQGRPQLTDLHLAVPTRIPSSIDRRPILDSGGPTGLVLAAELPGSGIPGGDPFRHGSPIAVQPPPKPRGPISISKGVAEGLILQQTLPAYPPIARAAGVEGTVILQAVISKDGTIEKLRVVGGPAMLQQAARDAVESWRYRPYLLNGSPVEVETTISVIFRMNR